MKLRICQGAYLYDHGDEDVQRRGRRAAKCAAIFLVLGGFLISPIPGHTLTVQASDQVSVEEEIPEDLRPIFEEVGKEFGICPELLEAMAYRESRFKPEATNGNYVGLMQVNVKIHSERMKKYNITDMTDPKNNITVAADYLLELYETYGDENPIVLGIYSGNWKSVSRYKETGYMCPYVRETLERSAQYERLHKK